VFEYPCFLANLINPSFTDGSYPLEPSVKEGLIKLSRKKGYSNTSKFLNDLLK